MAHVLYWVVCFTALLHSVVVALFLAALVYRLRKPCKRVCIVVLGDVGRSPRMQYHAQSFAREEYLVDVVGFGGSEPIPSLVNNPKVRFCLMEDLVPNLTWLPRILQYVFKTVIQTMHLFFVLLFCVEKPSSFLLQNPPAIPVMLVTWSICCIKGCAWVIDWHNYAYSILALNLKSKRHPLVRFSSVYEGFFGRLADRNICVTNAMKSDLSEKWGISSVVLHDRPADQFKEVSIEETHHLFQKLGREHSCLQPQSGALHETLVTEKLLDGAIRKKRDRPAVLVTCTSWTEDEDFSLLMHALELYEDAKHRVGSDASLGTRRLPNILCCITGKGPLKELFMKEISKKSFRYVSFLMPWLAPEDYPKFIASADLGICLHTSSSGLDLPMKVVDMFGCCLPVCAVDYACLHELVRHDENGLVFRSKQELSEQIIQLLGEFPEAQDQLTEFRMNLRMQNQQAGDWHKNWKKFVLPLFDS